MTEKEQDVRADYITGNLLTFYRLIFNLFVTLYDIVATPKISNELKARLVIAI